MSLLSNISEVAKETLWPTRCAICDTPGSVLCEKCRNSLLFVDSCKACERCGAPFGKQVCTECNKTMIEANGLGDFPLTQLRHAVVLDDCALKIIKVYKDNGERRLKFDIASMMASYIEPVWIEQNSLLTFIPATREAVARRGFDHAEEIATEIGNIAQLDVVSLFSRPESTDQRALGRLERLENMKTRFQVIDNPEIINDTLSPIQTEQMTPHDNSSRPIIIVDVVCTSGATLYSAALALRDAGFNRIYGLTFGRVLG